MRKVIVEFTNDFRQRNDALWVRSCLQKAGYSDIIVWKETEYELPRGSASFIETEESFSVLAFQIKQLTSWIPHISSSLKMNFFIPTQIYIDTLYETIVLHDCTGCGC